MRVDAPTQFAIVGGGPAGLYMAYRLKRRMPNAVVCVYEQNTADATFGFGVVFSDQALAFLKVDDSETAAAITPCMTAWQNMCLNHRGETITLDGIGFAAIGRLQLLQLFQQRATEAGAKLYYGVPIESLDRLDWAHLVIGADGLNSIVRQAHVREFETSISYFSNKFIWYGTTQTFDTLTQTFVDTAWGPFNAHHYRYAVDCSTFIVECSSDTWQRAGFAHMSEVASRQRCQAVFAEILDGHQLIANKSAWGQFPKLWNDNWSVANRVLIGDALHTAHFSIGSGTRLAIEDAIALDRALAGAPNDLPRALADYQAARQPVVQKLVQAANTSALWYDDFGRRMALDPIDFGFDYITRSGRVTIERLRKIAPEFAATYEAKRLMHISDPVADNAAGAGEVGFLKCRHANASEILFDNLTNGNRNRPAIKSQSGTVIYSELCANAARYGNALHDLGLKRGDRVILLLDDTPACPAAFFGAMRAGFVPVIINTLTPPDLLRFYLLDTEARVAICEAEFAVAFTSDVVTGTKLQKLVTVNGKGTTVCETITEKVFLASSAESLAVAPTSPDEMAFWLYSSGTTGRPKGIVHLHHDMAYTAASYANSVLKLTPDDICYSVPKIFFAYGLGNSLTFPFSAGACCVLVPGQPRPETVLDAIETFRPTVFFGLPTLYTALARAASAVVTNFSSLRLSISAAETLSETVFNEWRNVTGQEIIEGLGSTELLHIYLSNSQEKKKLGAAGQRVPGYEIQLRDADGNVLDDNEEGLLWVRGHSSAPLYWNRPGKTAETMQEDWINTGDRFSRDGDGYYFFKGRADDLIKVSGQWVHPLEVERCLQAHVGIAECAVLAHRLEDQRMTLRAVVVLKDGAPTNVESMTRELQDFVKHMLLPYKYPRIIEYRGELPKTATGKIDRQTLKVKVPDECAILP